MQMYRIDPELSSENPGIADHPVIIEVTIARSSEDGIRGMLYLWVKG